MTNAFAGSRSRPEQFKRRAVRAAASIVLFASLAACSSAAPSATPGASKGPTTPPTPVPSPTTAGLQHPTGARDVVLRLEESGGFMPVEFMATSAPSFTLYGDGTVVFRDATATPPQASDTVVRSVPFMTARLNEEAIQALLNEALGPGALAIAKGPYMGNGADIPTTTFTVSIGGQTKSVSVSGLSPPLDDPDKGPLAAPAGLAQKAGGLCSPIPPRPPARPSA